MIVNNKIEDIMNEAEQRT